MIFRRKHVPDLIEHEARILQAKSEYHHALEENKKANSEFHDIKGICGCGPTIFQELLDAIADKRLDLTKEKKHG